MRLRPFRVPHEARFALGALVVGGALALLPLLQTNIPPLFDYPNHLARMHLLAHREQLAALDGIYTVGSFLLPNVLADIVGIGLIRLMDTFTAGMVLLGIILLTIFSGAFALHFAVSGRPSPWPAVVVPFLFNEMFYWGFLNYMLGLGLLLWGVAAWIHFGQRSRRWQMLIGTAFALALFLAHLVAFGLYAIAIGLIEARRAWLERRSRREPPAVRLLSSAACFLPAFLLFHMRSPARDLDLGIRFDFDPFLKLSPFTRLLSSGNPAWDVAVLGGMTMLILALLAQRRLVAEPALMAVAATFVLLALALPYTAMGSYFLDSRIPIAAALLALVALRPVNFERKAAMAVATVMLALIAGRAFVITGDWRESDRYYARAIEAFELLPERSFLMATAGMQFEFDAGWLETRTVHPPHEHVAHYATIVSGAVVNNTFGRKGQNPLVYQPSSEMLAALNHGPIPFVPDENAMRWVVDAVVAGMDADATLRGFHPFLVAHRMRCSEWPPDVDAAPVFCAPQFSLMALRTARALPVAGHRSKTQLDEGDEQ